MAYTESRMIPLGTPAPPFCLPDTLSGRMVSLDDKTAPVTVLCFICNHCPYVVHINPELIRVAHDYQAKGVRLIAISSNDEESYPQDGPEAMRRHGLEQAYPFPYLYDADQSVARAYSAVCTPDIFVFDKELRLAYRGRLDDSRPSNGVPLSGRDLRAALDALLSGKAPDPVQHPAGGCNIKWKAGMAPVY